MANTFSQIHIQIVFAVQGRDAIIHSSWEDNLYKYITGIVQKKEQKMMAINGMPDHIHFLIGLRPSCCLADLIRDIKKASNEYIKENKYSKCKFNWQEGYGAFSYSYWDVDKIITYIHNQKVHHDKKSFKEEYEALLKDFNVAYDEKYLFEYR